MSDPRDNLSNHGFWYVRLCECKSLAELDQIILDIDCDKWEDEGYTKNEQFMAQLREKAVEVRSRFSASERVHSSR